MAYIFLDESGDLSFDTSKKGVSQHFLIAGLLVENKRPLEKIVRRVFEKFTKKERSRHSGTLHSYKEKAVIKRGILKDLSKKEVGIVIIKIIKAHSVGLRLRSTHQIYAEVTKKIIEMGIKTLAPMDECIIITSQRETSAWLKRCLKKEMQALVKDRPDVKVEIKAPYQEKCLQIADLISWSFFKKYEHDDPEYSDIIQLKVLSERVFTI